MKDLFVLTADLDTEVVLRTILARPKALGIRPIHADVQRYAGRDSGMVRDGPEIARGLAKKSDYSRLILIWDHAGSGWEARAPDQCVAAIQSRLDGATWAERSAAVIVVPEIEEWIWHSRSSIAKLLSIPLTALDRMTDELSAKSGLTPNEHRQKYPKELFEKVLYLRQRRKPLPSDFAAVAERASLKAWKSSKTFARLVEILEAWFPSPTS